MEKIPYDCGHNGPGAGRDAQGKTHCYACCAEQDKQTMRNDSRITLYLTHDKPYSPHCYIDGKVTNWPGSLSLPCRILYRKDGHNWGIARYDVWFKLEDSHWHGVQYGENTQLVHCRKLKRKE